MSRFERPDTKTLSLSNGDTLVVKKRLNAGERRRMFLSTYREAPDGTLRPNPGRLGLAKVLAFLLDWSFVDDQGQTVVIRDQPADVVEPTLDALKPESFEEVVQAIEMHEAAMALEREKEKNALAGAIASPTISPSPSGAAGAMNG